MLRKITIIALTVTLVFTMSLGSVFGCTTVFVGKDKTADGSVLFAHSEELGDTPHHLVYVPRGYHEPGAKWVGIEPNSFLDGIDYPFGPTIIDQVPMTYAFIAATCFDKAYAPGDYSSGVNEMGITIGNNMTYCKDYVRGHEYDLREGGLIWTEFTQLVLERASTAREGVEIIGSLLEQCGVESGDPGTAYMIADRNEGWVIELSICGQWMAKKLPDDGYYVLPNSYTIGAEADLDSPDVLYSPDIISYAVSKGWYDPDAGVPFSFKDVYGTASNQAAESNNMRIREVGKMLDTGLISKEKMFEVMRTCYEDTDIYRTNANGSPLSVSGIRTVSRLSTEASCVVQLRSDLPLDIGTTIWWAMSTAKTNPYIPYYPGATTFPPEYQVGDWDNRNNPVHRDSSAYWRAFDLARLVHDTYTKSFPYVKSVWDEFEKTAFDNQAALEAEAMKIRKTHGVEAAALYLNNYSNKLAREAYEKTGVLIKQLRNQIAMKVDVSASVEKLTGNQNVLTINIHDVYFNGTENDFTLTVKINNNAAGVYEVGDYKVYVDTKGNTQIRECYIVN